MPPRSCTLSCLPDARRSPWPGHGASRPAPARRPPDPGSSHATGHEPAAPVPNPPLAPDTTGAHPADVAHRTTDPRAADRRAPRTRDRAGLRRRSHALPHRARPVSCRGRTGPSAPDRRRAQGARARLLGWIRPRRLHRLVDLATAARPRSAEVAGEADLGFRLLPGGAAVAATPPRARASLSGMASAASASTGSSPRPWRSTRRRGRRGRRGSHLRPRLRFRRPVRRPRAGRRTGRGRVRNYP